MFASGKTESRPGRTAGQPEPGLLAALTESPAEFLCGSSAVIMNRSRVIAPLAQLDRASGYEPEGREFESLRARHFSSSFTTVYAATATACGSVVLGTLGTEDGSGTSKPSPILAATS
jgi:hypothetical protein